MRKSHPARPFAVAHAARIVARDHRAKFQNTTPVHVPLDTRNVLVAMAAARMLGRAVYVRAGNYFIRTDGTILRAGRAPR